MVLMSLLGGQWHKAKRKHPEQVLVRSGYRLCHGVSPKCWVTSLLAAIKHIFVNDPNLSLSVRLWLKIQRLWVVVQVQAGRDKLC